MRRAVVVLAAVIGLAGVLAGADGSGADPVPEAGSSDWRTVATGEETTCAIRTSGRLFCWGDNEYGTVGRGTETTTYETAVEAEPGARDWTAVSTGGNTACGRRANGRLYCWGDDTDGHLGNGPATGDRTAPALVAGGFTDWTSVSVGVQSACGRRANGRLYCWGADGFGQLGNGPATGDRTAPTPVAGGFTDWTAVSVGMVHACGRRANGRLYCWGTDVAGVLGDGPGLGDRNVPTLVGGGITNWTSVSVGETHTCGRRANARLYCWGSDAAGAVGNGPATTGDRHIPSLVAGTGWSSVDAGADVTCGRRSTGRLYCWGDDDRGDLGNDSPSASSPSPVQVAGQATDWTAVSAGDGYACATTTAHRLYCWGGDDAGRLGNDPGVGTDQHRPVEVYVV